MPRLLLKLSGEAFAAGATGGIDPTTVDRLATEIRDARELGARIAVVLGGGNLLRGAELAAGGHGPGDRRSYGHARHLHERAGLS